MCGAANPEGSPLFGPIASVGYSVEIVPPSIRCSGPEIEAARADARKTIKSATLLRLGGPAEWDPAYRLHDDSFTAFVVGSRLFSQPLGKPYGRLGLNPPWRDASVHERL